MSKICFITTGDIKTIATAKRALGLANPLADMGWDVSIIMEDTEENHHRCELECDARITLRFYPHSSCKNELRYKNKLIQELDPDCLYICAFVARNIVGLGHRSKKLVEHSELQSKIPDVKGFKLMITYFYEYFSIIYSDAILNASRYLEKVYQKRARKMLKTKMPMLYFPYAFNPNVISVKNVDFGVEKYAQFKDTVNFVFLGTVTRNYGVFTILDAVKKLKSIEKNFKMLILGKGRHYEEAKQYIQDNKLEEIVYMPGFVAEEEIANYFSLASAFVSPMNDTVQDWARCPSKMYLYIPYGKPVITCKIGEPYEILQETGYYYESGNSDSMEERMLQIIRKEAIVDSINPEQHTWNTRAVELSNWLNHQFQL